MNATIIYTTTDTAVNTPLCNVSIDPTHKIVGIYRKNGNWDEYELIDYDKVDNDLFATVGKYIRTSYQS